MEKDYTQYDDYTIEELVLDRRFCEMVKGKQDEFDRLLESFPDQQEKYLQASRIVKGLCSSPKKQTQDIKDRIWSEVVKPEKKVSHRFHFIRYAAAIVLTVGVASFYYYLKHMESDIVRFAESSPTKTCTETQLILYNGKNLSIQSEKAKIEHAPNGEKISVNNTVVVDKIRAQKGYNQLIVPFGRRTNVTLPDGTNVALNSGSRLVYPICFDRKQREVFLEGEAFFDVAKDLNRPFWVKTEGFKLRVLGTKFNIQAYQGENEFNALLVEGSIKMETNEDLFAEEVMIEPNQIANISADKKHIGVAQVENVQNYISWMNGYLDFRNEKLGNLLRRVSRYYNVEIECPKGLEEVIYIGGKLELKEDPDRILDGLCVMAKIRYKKEGGKYIIRK